MVDDRLIAGVDAGTTRIRALVFTPEGRVVAEGSRPTPVERPRPGWAEHDALALWQSACGALCDAIGRTPRPARICGIAVASVGEALVALDGAGRPTGPVIAWYDERPTPQLARLEAALGRDRLYALTGLSPDATFSLCKLLWLKEHQPEAMARTRLWLNLADYLAWRLCGVPGTDLSLASRTLALDLHHRRWAEDLIAEVGLAPAMFPQIRPCGARLGRVTPEAAAATGLPADCVVAVAGHDHMMGALAADAMAPGVLLDSMGSAEGLILALAASTTDLELARRGYSQGVVEVDRPIPYLYGGFPASGAAIEWFRALFGAGAAHAELIAEAEGEAPTCHGVTFVPDLRGRISPVPDAAARGAWFGIGADATRATLYRALLEGLAFEARQTVDSLVELPGLPRIETIRATGGNTRNRLLMAIKAAVYGRAITAAGLPEATALGAALLGGLAAGLFSDLPSAVAGLAATSRSFEPDARWAARYEAHYRDVYQPAYQQLRPLHHAAAALRSGGPITAPPPG
jgi:xylulokinase